MKNNTARIATHLFYEMPIQPTDVGMVLGCQSISGEAARVTAKLYREGVFPKIIVSGGAPASSRLEQAAVALHSWRGGKLTAFFDTAVQADFASKKKESEYIVDVLEESGVARKDIVCIDYASTNTQQNFQNCINSLTRFNSASLITYAAFQRRALGTARANPHLNQLALQTVPVYPFGVDAKNWDSWPMNGFVKAEFAKIDPQNPKSYIGRFCVDPDIEQEIARMTEQNESEKLIVGF